MKKNTIVRHCFSRKYISLCIFLLLGIIGEKAFAYSVWETYANETEGIYFSLQESIVFITIEQPKLIRNIRV